MDTDKEQFEVATEKVVRAKIVLANAEAERDQVYRRIIGHNPERTETKGSQPTNSKASKILAVLAAEPSKEWSYEELEQKLPEIPTSSLRSFLFKLRRNHQIQKAGRGSWKAK